MGLPNRVVLEVSLPGLEKDQAEKIAEEAHAFAHTLKQQEAILMWK